MEHVPVTFAQLRELGLRSPTIKQMVDDGRLRRLRHGMYVPGERASPEEVHLALVAATQAIVDPTNVLSHTSAALVHGLPVRRTALHQVTMTRQTPGHGDGGPTLRVRNTRITQGEIQGSTGQLITTLARTVADVARLEPAAWGVAAADAALAQGLETEQILEVLGEHPRLQGVRRARTVAAFADARAESPLESISRMNMHLAGLPEPELQVEHFDDDGVLVARSDFFWREHGVAGECHGRSKFVAMLEESETTEQAIDAALNRDQALRRLGIRDINWIWETAQSPQELRRLLAPVVGLRSAA